MSLQVEEDDHDAGNGGARVEGTEKSFLKELLIVRLINGVAQVVGKINL